MITVLMSVYNGEKYLRPAIESILNQSYEDFEFLILNDGSKDGSREIISSFNDPRIRLIDNDRNHGLIYSLNKGIEISKGKYIARMDADDLSLPNRLEKQVDFLDKNTDIALVGSYGIHIDENGVENNIIVLPSLPDHIFASLFFGNSFIHASVMVRSEVLRKYRYTKEYIHAEDFFLWSQIAREHKVANIPEPLVKYRIHNNSVSVKKREEQEECVKKILFFNLANIGINELTFEEKKLHDTFLLYKFTPATISVKELWQVNQWIKRISYQNRRLKVYDKYFFYQKLKALWGGCFNYYISYKLGIAAIPLVFFSLSRDASIKSKVRFALRCLKKYHRHA